MSDATLPGRGRPAVPATPREARRSHLESAGWRRTLLWGLRLIPLPVQRATMPLWSAFFYAQVPHVRRAIIHNLARLSDGSALERELAAFRTFTNYCRCIANAYRTHAGAPLAVAARIEGLERLTAITARGQGLVLATGHIGNWHLGPYFLAQEGLPPLTVVMNEEPDPGAQAIDAALRDGRMRVAYLGQSPLLGLELRGALARGELVGLQLDRPSLGGALRVPCAGGQAQLALGPALLARACGVPVVPVFFPLAGAGLRIVVEEPIWPAPEVEHERDLRRITEELAAVYGRVIARHPEQWFNFFDFFTAEAR